MKNLLTIPFILMLVFSSCAQTEKQNSIINKIKTFPRYETVVNYFFDHYLFDSRAEDQLKFARKPDGWHVYRKDEVGSKILNDQLLWSVSLNQFAELKDYLPNLTLQKTGRASFLRADEIFLFDRVQYYGYDGWDKDVISDFGYIENLSDTDLFGLARAYQNYSNEFVTHQYDFHSFSNNEIQKMTEEERFQKYVNNTEFELKTLQRLIKINPEFETVVGSVKLKYADEVMDYFQRLSYTHREAIADKYFAQPIYNDFMIGFAKNMLTSCDSNAILFTNGDNDTYPLWYVQQKLNFRRDVTVANLSLLNLGSYIEYVKDKANAIHPLQSSFSKGQFDESKRDYVMYKEEKEKESHNDLLQVLRFIACENDSCKTSLSDESKINYFSDKTFYFPVDIKNILAMNMVEKKFLNEIEYEMSWSIKNNYLTKSEIAVLDFFANNFYERPICFASTVGRDNEGELDKYFQQQGIAYRVVPVIAQEYSTQNYSVSIDKSYDVFMNKSEWKGLINLDLSEKRIVMNYRISFGKLVSALIDEGKRDSAKKVLKKCEMLFPQSVSLYDYFVFPFVKNYYELKDTTSAIKLSRALAANCADFLSDKREKFRNENFVRNYDEALYIIQNLSQLAEENNKQKIADELKGIVVKYWYKMGQGK